MSEKRYRILSVALEEIGCHDEDLPFPGKYYAAGYNWCSEFVSWVYKQAGCPFTEGGYSQRIVDPPDDGKWMQRSSSRCIEWFKANGFYVHREDTLWYSFTPKLGDYVFIGRYGSDRMHSGLVEYLGCDGTLHTIEGNNAGRAVMKFQYPHYKINSDDNGEANGVILGFGVI